MNTALDKSAQNKQLAARLFERFTAGDLPGVMDLMAPDVNWWIAGKPGQLPVVGDHDRQRIERLFRRMTAQLKGPLCMTVKSAIAEGDRVAMEVESRGELLNGRLYEQQYHFLITVRDGRIADVREYLDTLHVQAVWGG
jgi:ketosteroid isomerase-like protein